MRDILESELQQYIHSNFLVPNHLKNRGLEIDDPLFWRRHPSLGPYGIPDIITMNYYESPIKKGKLCIEINILELKATPIIYKTYFQALRYASGVKHFLWHFLGLRNVETVIIVSLIGSKNNLDKIDTFPVPGLVDVVNVYSFIKLRSGEFDFTKEASAVVCLDWIKGRSDAEDFLFKEVINKRDVFSSARSAYRKMNNSKNTL